MLGGSVRLVLRPARGGQRRDLLHPARGRVQRVPRPKQAPRRGARGPSAAVHRHVHRRLQAAVPGGVRQDQVQHEERGAGDGNRGGAGGAPVLRQPLQRQRRAPGDPGKAVGDAETSGGAGAVPPGAKHGRAGQRQAAGARADMDQELRPIAARGPEGPDGERQVHGLHHRRVVLVGWRLVLVITSVNAHQYGERPIADPGVKGASSSSSARSASMSSFLGASFVRGWNVHSARSRASFSATNFFFRVPALTPCSA